MNSKTPKIQSIAVAAAGVAALIGVFLASAPFVRIVDNALHDGMLTSISPWTKPRDDIVLVTVNEGTLSKFAYRSPVDRKLLADTLSAVLAGGPKAVGLDILFDQPTEPKKDNSLRRVLVGARHPVVIAHAGASNGLTERQTRYLAGFSQGLLTGAVDLGTSPVDGTVRTLISGLKRNGAWLPGFATRVAMTAGIDPPEPKSGVIPMTYYRTKSGAPHAFKQYPAEAARLLPPVWFENKFVLIGVDLPDSDRHRTPFHLLNGPAVGVLPGIAIHAHGLAQLLAGDRLRRVSVWWQFVTTLVLCSIAIGIAYLGSHPVLRLACLVALCIGLWTVAMTMFNRLGILMPLAGPTLAIVVAGGVGFAQVWYRDRQQRSFITDAFSRYVSPAYVDRLIAHPEELNLGGQRREVSYIFTDIAGFTGLSEQVKPAVLSELLNSYLDSMCGLFLEHGATIDKIIGDAVVGFIGAPVDQPDHAAKAVQLMLAIDRFSEAFRREQRLSGHVFGETRVGVHTGVAVIGNFGGSQFFDYTGLGDSVNTAARLEGANKFLGTRLCVSNATADASGWQYFRPVGTITLKGKTEGIDVLEPVTELEGQTHLFHRYQEAFAALKACDRNALELLRALAVDCPEDRLVAFHVKRLRNGETGTTITLTEK